MAQPFRAYAKTLLERQNYPVRRPRRGAPPDRPYDVAGWTLPLQMNVQGRSHRSVLRAAADDAARARVDCRRRRSGATRASPRYYVIDGRGNGASIAINRLLRPARGCRGPRRRSRCRATPIEPGRHRGGRRRRACASRRARSRATWGLRATAAAGRAPPDTRPLARVRVGLYKSVGREHRRRLDAVAARAVRVPVRDDHRRRHPARRLACRASTRSSFPIRPPSASINGHPPGTMPPEYTGGIGTDGRRHAAAVRRRRRHAGHARFGERARDQSARARR